MTDDIIVAKTQAGIPVVVERMPYSRSASVSVYFGIGSRDESREEAGIAHMLEHMLFKGTHSRSPKQMSEEIEAAGGEQNGYTSKEVTSFQAFTLDETLSTGEDILADMVLHPLIDKESMITEKNVVLQEIGMMQNDPDDYIHVLFSEALWGITQWDDQRLEA